MKNSLKPALLLALVLCTLCVVAACGKKGITSESSGNEGTTAEPAAPQTGNEETTGIPDTTTAPETTEPVTPVDPVVKKAVITGGGAGNRIYSAIVELSGKKNPRVVILTTAGKDTVSNVTSYTNIYSKYTNDLEVITLCTKLYDPEELRQKIINADIICVSGGQSEYMGDVWKKFKVDEYLREAYDRGVICSGGSAGGMCWTYMGWNDFYSLPESVYDFYYGIDVINIYYGPHFNSSDKWAEFDSAIRKQTDPKYTLGFAMDNGSAVIFIDGEPVKSIRETGNKRIFRYDFKDGKWARSVFK